MEEDSLQKLNSKSGENPQNNSHLDSKLVNHFSPPLILGIVGGIIIYIICSILYIKQIKNINALKKSMTKLNLEQTEQLIYKAENVLKYRTQIIFDLLRKIENTTKFFSDLYDEGKVKKDSIDDYIKENMVNLADINEQTDKDLFKGIWGRNEIKDNREIDENIKKNLYIFSALNSILNVVYNSTNLNEEYIENIYIIINKHELFYDYPLTNDTMFKMGSNRIFCFNELTGEEKKIIIPEKYDYHCQSWFSDSINLHRIANTVYYLSPPYYIQRSSKILITTLCLNSTRLSSNQDFGDYFLICINVKYQYIFDALELINHKISGYFFVTRVFNQKAFYYPKSHINQNNKTYLFDNFNIEEFQFNDDFYLDEINEYMNDKNSFINSYNVSEIQGFLNNLNENLKGNFVKNNKKYIYYMLPVFHHFSFTVYNLLNIIYIYPEEVTDKMLNEISNELINSNVLAYLFIILILQAFVVITLVNYLIRAIALNIVLPMKNIKKIFEKFNNENDGIDNKKNLLIKNNNSSNNITEKETLDEINNNKAKNKMIKRSKSNIFTFNKKKESSVFQNIKVKSQKENKLNKGRNFFEPLDDNDDFLNNYKDLGSDSDDEENYINIKSKDIQDLFSKMINMKNSLDTVNSDEQNDIKKLSDMLFASDIFTEIKNIEAKNVCQSNIANIFLKLKKYDIAIMHLIESEKIVEEESNNEQSKDSEISLFNITPKSKKKKKGNSIIKRGSLKDNKLTKEQKEQKVIEENKPLIENRYPKLIYCYKKFFKSLKRLKKMNLTKELFKSKLTEYEFYVSKKHHMLNNYKEYIEKYIELCKIEGNYLNTNNKYIQSLMEKIEFIIKYEICEDNFNNIEEELKSLHDLFVMVKKLIKANKEIIKPKNILKFLINEEFTNELDEIPNCILMQRLLYYKGNLALKCGHYMEAVKKFQKVFLSSSEKIIDIKYTVKSFKKLIKIAELMKEQCETLRKSEEKNILNQYIQDKAKELKKFNSVDRNFIILISTNTENIDFFINSIENAKYIIDNYIKGTDKFCLAFISSDKGLGGGLKVISKLEEKDKINYDVLFEFIQDIKQDYDLLSNYQENGEDDISFILQKAKVFSCNNERKTFYLFFGNKDRLSHESMEFLYSDEMNQFLDKDKEKLILIINENYEMDDKKSININNDLKALIPVEEKALDINKLNKKICSFVHFDDIQKIKNDVMIYGKINSLDNYFNIEKYELKKYD